MGIYKTSNKTCHASMLSVCAKWKKSETCMSKPHWSDNVISLKDTFSIWKDHYLISAITGFVQNIFNRILENEVFDSYLPLKKCLFSVHFNEIVTQWSSLTWKSLSVFLYTDGAVVKYTIKMMGFSYHGSSTAQFLQGLTLKIWNTH